MVKISSKLDTLTPYEAGHDDYAILLNANESFVPPVPEVKREMLSRISKAAFNRYPDPAAAALCEKFGRFYGVDPKLVVAGNGSDEIIGLLYACLLDPGDKVMTLEKDFSMYSFYCHIYNCTHVEVAKESDLSVNVEKVISAVKREKPQMLLFSNPCNPTSLGMRREDVVKIIENCDTLVVVDEAYMEFKGSTHVDLIENYPNLLVLRTLSKAFGMAGIRCGYCLGNKALIDVMYKVKSPYNLNVLTQKAAVIALKNRDKLLDRLKTLNAERHKMYKALRDMPLDSLYPTASNFIYFETGKGEAIYEAMKENGILIKFFKGNEAMPVSIRLSIGTPEENRKVLEILKKVL